MGSSSLLRWQCFGRGRRPPSSSPSTSAMTTGRSSSAVSAGCSYRLGSITPERRPMYDPWLLVGIVLSLIWVFPFRRISGQWLDECLSLCPVRDGYGTRSCCSLWGRCWKILVKKINFALDNLIICNLVCNLGYTSNHIYFIIFL